MHPLQRRKNPTDVSAALAYLEDDLPIPRPARHLYLVAVDGRIIKRADRDVVTNGNQKQSYRDARELINTVIEENRPFDAQGKATSTSKAQFVTRYLYDPLKQITRVIDTQGNTTSVEYDNLGRRTAIDNPDTGRVETVYDLASNPVKKITANLRAMGPDKAIEYDYDHTRLIAIHHPLYPDANVTYTYGGSEDRGQ